MYEVSTSSAHNGSVMLKKIRSSWKWLRDQNANERRANDTALHKSRLHAFASLFYFFRQLCLQYQIQHWIAYSLSRISNKNNSSPAILSRIIQWYWLGELKFCFFLNIVLGKHLYFVRDRRKVAESLLYIHIVAILIHTWRVFIILEAVTKRGCKQIVILRVWNVKIASSRTQSFHMIIY